MYGTEPGRQTVGQTCPFGLGGSARGHRGIAYGGVEDICRWGCGGGGYCRPQAQGSSSGSDKIIDVLG